jgi:hypothetical protein
MAGEWNTASDFLAARLTRDGGATRLAQHFRTHHTPDAQSVVVALAAGDKHQVCGVSSILSLPALVVPNDALKATLM